MAKYADHHAYIAAAPEAFRPLLFALHGQLAAALPDAEQLIRYEMPGFCYGKQIVAGYAAFTNQCGLYVEAAAIAAHAEEIAAAGLKSSKTGVTFSPRRPIPGALVRNLALSSRRALGN